MTPPAAADDSLRSLSLDLLNLLINGQAFSDVTFSVDGRLVHAHRCILAARSLFFRKFFCDPSSAAARVPQVVPVSSVGYEVFLLMLQFLYSGHCSIVPQKHEPRPNCGERGCWHTHCSSAVDLAVETLAAARSFGVEQLALLTQKQLISIVEKASIEDVMKVLLAARTQDMHQLSTTCTNLVAKSGIPPEILAKHLPIEVVAKIEELRLKSSFSSRRALIPHPHHDLGGGGGADMEEQKIRRMRRALDSSDVELVKLMVMGEGLNLDEVLALHYAVENCTREVVKALLELGAADVNLRAGPAGKTPLHIAAEMVSPDMVAVLLDHHADPNCRTVDGVTALDVLRTLTSDFLFKGAVPGLAHIEPNKLRLCLELVQSAVMVISREDGNAADQPSSAAIFPPISDGIGMAADGGLNLDSSRMMYHGMAAGGGGDENRGRSRQREGVSRHCSSMYHHLSHNQY